MGQEPLGGSSAVGTEEDIGVVAMVVRQSGERGTENADVVDGGADHGVAGPQRTSQGLAGVLQDAQRQVVAEAVLVRSAPRAPSRSGR